MKGTALQHLVILGVTAQSGIHMHSGVMPADYNDDIAHGTTYQWRGDVEEGGRGFVTPPQVDEPAAPEVPVRGHIVLVDPDDDSDDRMVVVVRSNFVPPDEPYEVQKRAETPHDEVGQDGWAQVKSNFLPDTEALDPSIRAKTPHDEVGEDGRGFRYPGEPPANIEPFIAEGKHRVEVPPDAGEPGWADVKSNFVPPDEPYEQKKRVSVQPDERGSEGWAQVRSNFVPPTEALDPSIRASRTPDSEDEPGVGFLESGNQPADVEPFAPQVKHRVEASFPPSEDGWADVSSNFVPPDEPYEAQKRAETPHDEVGTEGWAQVQSNFVPPTEALSPSVRASRASDGEDESARGFTFPGEVPADAADLPEGTRISVQPDAPDDVAGFTYPGEVPADAAAPEGTRISVDPDEADEGEGFTYPGEPPADVLDIAMGTSIAFRGDVEGQGYAVIFAKKPDEPAPPEPVGEEENKRVAATFDPTQNGQGFTHPGVIPDDVVPPTDEVYRRIQVQPEDPEFEGEGFIHRGVPTLGYRPVFGSSTDYDDDPDDRGAAQTHHGVIPADNFPVGEEENHRISAVFDPTEDGSGFVHSGVAPLGIPEGRRAVVQPEDPEFEGQGFVFAKKPGEPQDVGEEENHRVSAEFGDGVQGQGFTHSGVIPDDVVVVVSSGGGHPTWASGLPVEEREEVEEMLREAVRVFLEVVLRQRE